MKIKNLVACLGLLGSIGCSSLTTNVKEDELEREKARIMEEVQKVTKEITYDPSDYFNNSPYSFYYRSPQLSEKLGKGDCKDFAIVSANRLEMKGFEIFVILGKVDNRPHAWLEWYSNGIEYVIFPQEARIIEKSKINNKKYSPYIHFSKERRARIERLRKNPGCKNLKFNEDVPYKLGEFGKKY